jgi:CheY-like chemotaxis protein
MARILVVDDNPSSRELERIMLEAFGYEVVEASNCCEALTAALLTLPDLILLDLRMPGPDGFAILKDLRREHRLSTVPIVAITASAMKADRMRALKAGFSGYITKPIFLHEFQRQIRSFIRPKRTEY